MLKYNHKSGDKETVYPARMSELIYKSNLNPFNEVKIMKNNSFVKRLFAIFLVAVMMLNTVHLTLAAEAGDVIYNGPTDHDKSKTATDLYDNRYTDVTLSVPGKVETLSTDIVFVIDKSSSDKLSSDFANGFFEQLVEVQKKSGALVKVGVVIFNYDGHIALPLTTLTEENYQTLLDSLPSYSGGTNADAGLVLAKQMLDADTDVDASRKHVILIGDGKNWAFDVNGAPHTILLKSNAASTSTLYGAGTTTWLEGRKSSGYSIPKEFDSWNEYWEQVKAWVEADGDRYVFDITNYNSKDESLKPDYQSEEAVESAVIISESADHALNMDRALYDTWESYKALQNAGYNCNAYYSGTSSSDIGYCLMRMLADSKSMSFDDIKYDILYSVSKGSVIEDYIGFSADEIEGYNFDFIEQAEKLVLKVGDIVYSTAKLDEAKNGATSSYEFTAPGANEATFTLDYFKGNGTTTERFLWTFGENVSRFAPVSLTYTLDLVERSTVPGIHENVDTNISAILYPKDSDGNDGLPEEFEKPKVKYEVLPITVSGEKTWNDDGNRDGIRPESITINLFADGEKIASRTVTAENNWAWAFEGLREYKGNSKIVYTVTEETVDGYTAVVEGYNVTNTHAPEKTTVSGEKTWDDADNQDGKRPESITINLLANGVVADTKTVTEADGWKWSFEGVNKYENGEEIVYTITEEAVDGYETTVDGFNVTNTHAPEKIEISGTKTWNDDGNRDGIRPESITINLLANGVVADTKTVTEADGWKWSFAGLNKFENGEEIVYTITEETVDGYTTVIDGYNVTNTHESEKTTVSGAKTWDDADNADGIRPESITINLLANGVVADTKTVTEADGWAWSFAGLNKFENGEEIVYTITEDAVAGYETVVDGYNVTNVHVPEEIIIEDPEVPLAPPSTGDLTSLGMWIMMTAVSGGAALTLMAAGKKKEEREANN